ncbi:MAG: PKD domain-containing protein, partial [Methylosarcina sp.]
NKAPKAEAGKNQKVTVGTEVHLDGSTSHDDDNGPSPLTYQWMQKSGPAITLNGADTATPSFIPTVKGSYKFSLVVNDGTAESKADKVTVQIKKTP